MTIGLVPKVTVFLVPSSTTPVSEERPNESKLPSPSPANKDTEDPSKLDTKMERMTKVDTFDKVDNRVRSGISNTMMS